ncbi:hypothetical protein EXIGLDRAFT_514334 [Exidia glandulosa HHB12029]|uniref:Uncharacterized protein n=1 Tax=Exidia glandulosa HHB12029 TaxID=1314781 RepID=A0A165PFW4_EXIGL|nr:hypothetical protein EXIGLDRAFT_514334 [Exidia glandulosa HHB12029]
MAGGADDGAVVEVRGRVARKSRRPIPPRLNHHHRLPLSHSSIPRTTGRSVRTTSRLFPALCAQISRRWRRDQDAYSARVRASAVPTSAGGIEPRLTARNSNNSLPVMTPLQSLRHLSTQCSSSPAPRRASGFRTGRRLQAEVPPSGRQPLAQSHVRVHLKKVMISILLLTSRTLLGVPSRCRRLCILRTR